MEAHTWQLFLLLGIIEFKCTGTIIGRRWQLGSGGHHKDISYEFRNNKNKFFQEDFKNKVLNVIARASDIISSKQSLERFHPSRHLHRKRNSRKDLRGKSQSIPSVMKTSGSMQDKLNISSESTSVNPYLGHEMIDENLQNASSSSPSRLIDEKSPSIELMSYSFSCSESENAENKTTILEKLEQRLNEVTEQYRSTPKSVKMINITEGVQTEINNLKGEKNSILSKSSSVLVNNYSSETIESLYNESNSSLKDRKKNSEFENILSSLRTSETESYPSFLNTRQKDTEVFFGEENNYHSWDTPSYKSSQSIWNLTSKDSSESLIKNLTEFKNLEVEPQMSLTSLQILQSSSTLGNKDSSLYIDLGHKLGTSFESQLPVRVVIPLPLNLLNKSTLSKNDSLEIREVTSINETEIYQKSKCASSTTAKTEDVNLNSKKNLPFIERFSSLGDKKEMKREDCSIDETENKESECKSEDEIILGTFLNSNNDKLWGHINEEKNLKLSKKSRSEEITSNNTTEINNLVNKNEKLNISTSEGNFTTQENVYILEGLGVFQDSLDEMSDFETELKENHEPAFESFNDDLPIIVFPKQANYEHNNLEHNNDFHGHYAQEISTIRLRTERNELKSIPWWPSENLKVDDNGSDKGILNLNKEHRSDDNLVQSQTKVIPENHSHSSTRSSRRIFKSFLPTIYVAIVLYVAAMILSTWFNETSFIVMKKLNLRNYLWKNDNSRTKTDI